MDAVTLAAAALAIAVDESRDAALRQALLERERLAMAVEDRDSFLAQRYFTGSMQLRGAAGHRPQTWQAAYEVRDDNFDQALDALREVRAANRQGDAERINDIVAMELGYSSDDEPAQPPELGGSSDEADSSDEAGDSDEEPAPPPTHRCVVCGLTRRSVNLMLPTGRWANLPMEQRLVCDDCDAAQ